MSLPITLALFVKNEEENLEDCIDSAKSIVSEIVVVDTGSTDNTIKLAKEYTDRVYSIGFTDFGSIRTITAHLAAQPWVLMLDADERLDYFDLPKFEKLIDPRPGVSVAAIDKYEDGEVLIDSWALPRKRWADRWMKIQEDVTSYPDWQVRLFMNHPDKRIKFVRRVHETVSGCIRTEFAPDGPHIHHFQNAKKTVEKLKDRESLYTSLYKKDIIDGVKHSAPPVIEEDKVK